MKLSDISIQRPVFAVVMSLLLLVLGVMSFTRLTLRELPAIDPPIVSVSVDYTGASAAVIESRITQVLEDALAGIEGIDTINARSTNGRSQVSIEFTSNRDIEAAANDVRDAVSRGPTACRKRRGRRRSPRSRAMPTRSSGSTWSPRPWTRWS
jgi:multidrug efflux pump